MDDHHHIIIKLLLLITQLNQYNFYNYKTCKPNVMNQNTTENKNIVALILARGGSKGIPLKNLIKINDQTLLGRSLETLKSTNIFESIWVSTDSEAIEMEAERYDGIRVHTRSYEYATDTTTSIDSVLEFLMVHKQIEHIALIQCTSIFLQENYLHKANELYQQQQRNNNNNSACVFAVVKSFKLRWKQNDDDGKLIAINFNPKLRPRRQDWRGELLETGMFYFVSRNILQMGQFQNDRCSIVEIQPEHALEIDTEFDLKIARCLIEN